MRPRTEAGQGFPPDRRLHRPEEFRAAYRHGHRRNGQFWSLLAVRRTDPGLASRLGLTTPRRLGAAPLRNRIRRRLRAMARGHWAQLPPGWDLVVHPRAGVARAGFGQLEAEWIECLRWLAHGRGPTLGQNKT